MCAYRDIANGEPLVVGTVDGEALIEDQGAGRGTEVVHKAPRQGGDEIAQLRGGHSGHEGALIGPVVAVGLGVSGVARVVQLGGRALPEPLVHHVLLHTHMLQHIEHKTYRHQGWLSGLIKRL
jgi:hypothetical protein